MDFEPSSGNVFADLGLPNPETLLAKAELTHRICAVIKQRRLTRRRVAHLLDAAPAEVAALVDGKFDSFSTERLFRFLNALGQNVEIVVRPITRKNSAATTVIVAVG